MLKKEDKKAYTITVSWIGCYELTKDGTLTRTCSSCIDVIEEELGLVDWEDDIVKNKDYKALTKILNKYCKEKGLTSYTEQEVKKNDLIDVIESVWKNKETISYEIDYE